MNLHRIISLGVLVGFNLTTVAAVFPIDKSKSVVEFTATGSPGGFKIVGTAGEGSSGGALQVNGTQVTGEVSVQLSTLDTGIELRTQHLKDKYLQVGQFPTAVVKLNPLTIPSPAQNFSTDGLDFTGQLLLHGESQPIKGTVAVQRQNGSIAFDFQFVVRLSDHKIEIPSFAGVSVKEDVKVKASFSGPLAN